MATPKPKMGNGKVEKVMKSHKEGKLSPKQKKIAGAAKPTSKITGDDFKALKKKKKKVI